jgi:hypothetical protein
MPESHDQDLFEIITHLVCSAPTSLDETRVLGAFRMVDAARQLIQFAARNDMFSDDPFLAEALVDYEAHVNLGLTDQDAFVTWLNSFVERFATEELARVRARGASLT